MTPRPELFAPPRRWTYLSPVRALLSATTTRLLRARAHVNPTARQKLLSGRTILISNHVSLLDGVLLALLSPVPLAVGVDSDWSVKNPWTASGMAFLCWLGYGWVVPLDAKTPHGLRVLARHIKAGRSVLLFPEGEISPDGRPLAARPGVQWLAERTKAQVVRASITGAERSRLFAKAGNAWWPAIQIEVSE